MEMKLRGRGKERERWSRLCYHGVEIHTHTHIYTTKKCTKNMGRESSKVSTEVVYSTDAQ